MAEMLTAKIQERKKYIFAVLLFFRITQNEVSGAACKAILTLRN